MSSGYNDPSFYGLAASKGSSHTNPAFDFLSGFAPRKLKDLFRWVEYLYYNSAHVFAGLRKFAEYPVTDLTFGKADNALKSNWERVLLESIKIKTVSLHTGLDLQLYGNSFISLYHPFNRFLICDACQARTGIRKVKYKFNLKKMSFDYTCPACNKNVSGSLKDEKISDEKRINVIRWDPKLIDINHNAMTGESRYYYTIPQDIKQKVEKGDQHIVNTMPVEFLHAIKDDKVFEFAEGQIYHMKLGAPAGISGQWGFPPLTSTIKLFFYTAVLRKANEAIALEHVLPFRVLHPAPISGTADPATTVNLMKWRQEMQANIAKWRRDPLHIMFAPTALGVTMMGGQGRSLLTLGEVKDAEDNIIAGMGVPREFIYGGLSFTGSAVTLRMLENQLETQTSHLNQQVKWIIQQASKILGWAPVDAKYIPFKLIDDAAQKQTLLMLNQAKPLVSDDTILSMHDLDINEEREKRQQEMLDDARFNIEIQKKLEQLSNSITNQAQQEASQGVGTSYNPQAILALAEQTIQQIMSTDPSQHRGLLDQLSQEDPVMYAVVKDRWQTMQNMQKQQAVSAMNGQA